jgi:hypothetical protein
MSAAQPVAVGDNSVVLLAGRRSRRPALSPRMMKATAVFALCLLGLIGSLADDAVAQTGLLLVGPTDDPGAFDNLTAALIWAGLANVAVCAALVTAAYWLISRPSAQIVALPVRRPKLAP